MNNERNHFLVALNLVPQIGPKKCRHLIQYFGSPEEVFKSSRKSLMRLKWMTSNMTNDILSQKTLLEAEDCLKATDKIGGKLITYFDEAYPKRLIHTPHAPVILYSKSSADLNTIRIVGIVGTRQPTRYGVENTEAIVRGLKPVSPLIVSGLAYGIDICAHLSALKVGLPTLAVLGGGLDRIYPAKHKNILSKMYHSGGALTEFRPGRKAEREHFPMRNRILAGLCDIVVVIESGETGGSMITARLANDYNREVGALPGRVAQPTATGTNLLIKNNEAHLIEHAGDVMALMQWNDELPTAQTICSNQRPDSQPHGAIYDLLIASGPQHVDDLRIRMKLTHGEWSQTALEMEMTGVLKIGPGNIVELCR